MRRQESNEANQVSRDKLERIRKGELQTELTLDDLDFLVSDERYEVKHVVGVARCLFKKHGLSFEKQFEVALSVDELKKFLVRSKSFEVDGSPLFIAYSTEAGHWVTFCVKYWQDGVVVLYKDPLGGDISNEIRETIENGSYGVICKVHRNKDSESGVCDGLIALRNMEIIMEKLTKNKKELIEDFDKTSFCAASDIELVKGNFRGLVGKDIDEKCVELVEQIAKNTEFKQAVAKLIDLCVDFIDLLPKDARHSEDLQDVADESEKVPRILSEGDKQVGGQDLNNLPQIKLWKDKVELAIGTGKKLDLSVDDATLERAACETELDQFPEEKQKFTRVFKLLGVAGKIHASERDGTLFEVCKKLGIDHGKITKLYQSSVPFVADVKAPVEESKPEEVVVPVDIAEIVRQCAEFACTQSLVDKTKVKSTVHVLVELSLGVAKEEGITKLAEEEDQEILKEVYKDKPRIKELERKFGEVKGHYENWKDKRVEEIASWATNMNRGLKHECLCEVVAIMDRANELVTGHFLRDTQILAVLDILDSGGCQGRLCQIATGEGKTVIVSLLATIKVLQGNKVDVITSNGVLAEEGVHSRGKFYGMFGISVAHNNPDDAYRRGPRKCYTADVVYGSMGSFQFDYLKHSFEGLETRGRRQFEFVVLDEVDSLLLDDGGHIAKLAEPFPGFDFLKYVYIKIWQELAKAEQELVREYVDELKTKSQELMEKSGTAGEIEFQYGLSSFTSNLFYGQEDKIIARIKNSDPANIDLIPAHLRQFARDMVDVWIKNAMYAKYSCHENEQYVVRKLDNDKEPKIVPVDYQGTGVTLRNTMWSNGLHQFVQLKHNLHLTSETLTSSLISNIGYVKLYHDNLFGLTGTLGSTAEQELLSSVYNVSYSRVPAFKSKVFEEICGKVVADDEFKKSIVEVALELTNKKRSVLIICSTINEVFGLEKKIKKLKQNSSPKVSTYFDETSSEVVQKEIGVGEIVISTNIAGRGSDFRTSLELEANGGLHVLVCFLPVNQRVEDQAFGRTSRQGNKGTAQIVMRESEKVGLGFPTGHELPFSVIKERRDRLEAGRLERIREVEIAQIDFHDRIFVLFSSLYRKFMKLEEKEPSVLYLMKDLKEVWAFWLRNKQKENVALASVDEEFGKFKRAVRDILGAEREDTFVGGKITHNPYYSIQQAEYFLKKDRLERAERSLAYAIKLSGDFSELLYPAFILRFELSVEQGQAVMVSFLSLIKRILKIDSKCGPKEDYKQRAKFALELSKKGLVKEIGYIESNFTGSDNNDFRKIFVPGPENVFAKHLLSKLTFLRMYLEHVNRLLVQIEASITEGTALALRARVTDYWNSKELSPEQKELRSLVCDDELREFSLKGLGTMYALKPVPPEFDLSLIKFGLVQIGIGATAVATGCIFPPSMLLMAKIAEVFIVEGVADVVIAIVTQGEAQFEWRSKLRRYGTSAISIGIFAVVRYTKIAQKAINFCQRLISCLKECPNLNGVCETLVPVLEKVIVMFENEIAALNVQKYGEVTLVRSSVRAVSNLMNLLVSDETIDGIIDRTLPQITEYVANHARRIIKPKTLKLVRKETVLELLSEVLAKKSNNVFKDITRMFVEYINSKVKSSAMPNSFRLKSDSYTEEVCLSLRKSLKQLSKDGSECCNSEEEVDEIFQAVVEMIAGHVNVGLKKQVKKVIRNGESFISVYQNLTLGYQMFLSLLRASRIVD